MENRRSLLKIASENDATLVQLAQTGDRTAFGLLYLRHHEAAWRVANAVTAFSSESAVVVVEAFARVLASPQHRLEPDEALRPALLVCVRQVAIERGAGRDQPAFPVSSNRESNTPTNEVVLAEVEPVVSESFRRLGEPERTALWLTKVEAFTPNEVGVVMELPPERAAALAVKGHHDLSCALARIFGTYGSGPCREAAPYLAGVRDDDDTAHPELAEHVGRCATCRMRRAEAADLSGTLRCAIPLSPLLGRSCHRRWLGQENLMNRRGAGLKRRVVVVLAALLVALLLSGRSGRRSPTGRDDDRSCRTSHRLCRKGECRRA